MDIGKKFPIAPNQKRKHPALSNLVKELHKVIHSTTNIRNYNTLFVYIYMSLTTQGLLYLLSAISPNFGVPYITDYFVYHVCHFNSNQNQSWKQTIHPFITTVVETFIHLLQYRFSNLLLEYHSATIAQSLLLDSWTQNKRLASIRSSYCVTPPQKPALRIFQDYLEERGRYLKL